MLTIYNVLIWVIVYIAFTIRLSKYTYGKARKLSAWRVGFLPLAN